MLDFWGQYMPEPEEPPAPDAVDGVNVLEWVTDHAGHADCVLALHPNKFLYCSAFGWLYYNGRYWQTDGAEACLGMAIESTLRQRAEVAKKKEWAEFVKKCAVDAGRVSGIQKAIERKVTVPGDFFDNKPGTLNVKNGVIDLRTGKLSAHNSETQHYTYCCNVEYDPKANQSIWLKFLNEMTDYADYLKTFAGYAITGDTREEKMLWVQGKTRSGKGVFARVLRIVLSKLTAELAPEILLSEQKKDDQNFALAYINEARIIFLSETSEKTVIDENRMKRVTGGDPVHCARKGMAFFDFIPKWAVITMSNFDPNIRPDDDAAWGRLHLIRCKTSFLGKEDMSLKERLTAPENLKGVLAWLVEGSMRWYKEGLKLPDEARQDIDQVRDNVDYVKTFISECVEDLPGHKISTAQIYSMYLSWCKENHITSPYGNTRFTQFMKKKGYKTSDKPEWVSALNKNARCFLDIAPLGTKPPKEKLLSVTP